MIIAVVAIVVVRLRSNREKTRQKVYQYDIESPVSVKSDTLKMGYPDKTVTYTGTFEPNKESRISSETQGKINAFMVDVGSVVSRGQVLVQLDNSLLKLQLQAVEVQIEGLQNDVNRYSVLASADAIQGVQLEKAEIGLKSAQVQKATLLEQINKTTVKSPFNGVVTAKLSEEGAFAAPGMPLIQITDISQLRFTVNVPESDLTKFTNNVPRNISADVFPDIELLGEPVMIGSKANMGNSFPVQFRVRNTKQSDIKAGMFGKVYITDTGQNEGVLVHSSAIIEDEENIQVYLIKNGKAVLQEITVSGYTDNMTVVSGGLQAGDVIVTSGQINLFNGANVVVRQ